MGLRQLAQYQAKFGNGITVPFQLAGAPTSGASGSFVGRAVVGSTLTDYTNGRSYVCTAASASSVTWQLVGAQV